MAVEEFWRVLWCKFRGHDWQPVGYSTMRKCTRCGELGWEVPVREVF